MDSHFIPSAAYKPLHASGLKVNEPMVLTTKRVFQSSRQITAHAFCRDCEGLFNRRGEAWVLNKLATLTAFPLRDMVVATAPIVDEPEFKVFSCDSIPGFQCESVVHLALGLFWKSAVRTWNMIHGPAPRIKLERYEEPVRQFLLGTGPFPEDICLATYLDSSTPPLIAVTPPSRFKNEIFDLFAFYINGLQCCLCVGPQARAAFAQGCIATGPGHPIFLVPEVGNSMFAILKDSVKKSTPSKGILTTLQQWRALRGKI